MKLDLGTVGKWELSLREAVTCLNPENGKTVKHKCSVMKRKVWIEYLREKAGL